MKKKMIQGKIFRSVVASAMAMTLAAPMSTLTIATDAQAADGILSQAIKTIDFENGTEGMVQDGEEYLKLVDGKPVIASGDYVTVKSDAFPEVKEDERKGNVLEFKNSIQVENFKKTESDELDDKYPVGTYIELKDRIGGRLKVDNPFKGMTFDEEEENSGVTISYWVKVPIIQVDKNGKPLPEGQTGEDRGANSTTLVFNNEGRKVMQKDDYAKWLVCQEYNKAVKENDTEALKEYSLGDMEIVTDAEGNKYVLHRNYGKFIRMNPNYPDADMTAQATKKGGWYIPKEDKDGKIEVTDSKGNKFKISSLSGPGETKEDSGLYNDYGFSYGKEDDLENGISSKSKVREEVIKGSLQLSTDNDFGFRDDHFRKIEMTDDAGNRTAVNVQGGKVSNPNSAEYGEYQEFNSYNQFYFDGDEFATSVEDGAAEKWHYVTIVIQNDWVMTYVDGEAADPEMDYQYMKETDLPKMSDHDFDISNVAKQFNRGRGLRDFRFDASNVADWSEDGTAHTSPANGYAPTMTEWLALESTELYLGGTGYASEMLTQSYGTIEGVCIDDISFFGTALTEDEACELYDEVKGDLGSGPVTLGDVDGNGVIALEDAQLALRIALLLEENATEQQKTAADYDEVGGVTLNDAQKILRKALLLD